MRIHPALETEQASSIQRYCNIALACAVQSSFIVGNACPVSWIAPAPDSCTPEVYSDVLAPGEWPRTPTLPRQFSLESVGTGECMDMVTMENWDWPILLLVRINGFYCERTAIVSPVGRQAGREVDFPSLVRGR